MKPLTRIIAATDLSAPARHAVERALQIAGTTGAHCTVIHALELDALDALREWCGEDLSPIKARIEEDARQSLAQLLASAPERPAHGAEVTVIHGTPLRTIIERADALAAELLVVGARGAGFLRHLLLGATSLRLLRKANRYPVLVVRQAPRGGYRRVLIPIDFSPVSVPIVRFVRRLAPAADLVLLHAFEVPFEGKLTYAGVDEEVIHRYRVAAREDALRRLRQAAKQAGLAAGDYTLLVVHGDPVQAVMAQEQERDCDLIALGKHGAHVAEDLLLGSVTKHVLMEAQADVLVVPDPRRPAA